MANDERRKTSSRCVSLDEAEKILRHRFDLLDYKDLDFGSPIDWHFDPAHQKRVPRIPWSQILASPKKCVNRPLGQLRHRRRQLRSLQRIQHDERRKRIQHDERQKIR